MEEFVKAWFAIGWLMMSSSLVLTVICAIYYHGAIQISEDSLSDVYKAQRALYFLLLGGAVITFISWASLWGTP